MSVVEPPTAASTPIVELCDIGMHYRGRDGTATVALDGIGLALHGGEFVSLVGPSGCGKSTVLRIAAGLLKPSSGAVRHEGAPCNGPFEGLGLVFQTPVLLPWLSVLDNVLLPIRVLGLPLAAPVERARRLLHQVGLGSFEQRYPRELSGGMQSRVALVRAIIDAPRLLLMDEPFAALDALTRETLNTELQAMWAASGQSVLFVTHSIPEAVFLSDRILLFSPRPGRIVQEFRIEAPRPRSYDMVGSGALGALAARIRHTLGEGR